MSDFSFSQSRRIRKELDRLTERAEAIHNALQNSDRVEYTDQERAELDEILNRRDALNKDLDRAISNEAVMQQKLYANLGDKLDKLTGESRPSYSKKTTSWNGKSVTILNRGDKAVDAFGRVQVANPIGELVKALACGLNRNTPEQIRNAMTTSDNTRGGFLVPSTLSSTFIDLARNKSVILEAGATTIMMEGADLSLARLLTDPTFAPHAELATISLSEATFGRVNLSAVTVACRMQLSRELIEDAPNCSEIIESTLASSLAQQVDYFAINGSGASFTGMVDSGDIDSTGSIGAIAWGDLSSAATTVRTNNIEPTAMVMYPTVSDAVRDSKDGQQRWLGAPPSLENVRMLSSKNIPVGYCLVGDFANLAWGVRQNPLLEVSNVADDSFEKHGVSVKMTWRGDFALLRASAFHRLEDVTAS